MRRVVFLAVLVICFHCVEYLFRITCAEISSFYFHFNSSVLSVPTDHVAIVDTGVALLQVS